MTPIRPAHARDVPRLRQIAESAYAGYVPRIGVRPAPMDADYEASVRDDVVLVADDGEVIGLVVLVRHDDHLLVENVAVDPARHGEGIGRALLAEAERVAVEHGLDELRLYTHVTMTENLAFYPRLGYRETGRHRDSGYDRVYFAKRLA